MAFNSNINSVVINGQSIIKLTPQGGSAGTLLFIQKPELEAKSIPYKATRGNINSGYDWTAKFDYLQTTAADFTDVSGSRQLSSFAIIGPADTFTAPNVFLTGDYKKTFNNTADSVIACEVFIPGVTITTSQSYMSASTLWS